MPLPANLFELFMAFLKDQTAENFLTLRSAWMALPEIDPYSSELDDVVRLITDGKHRDARALITKHINPQYLLSPGAHLHLSMCLEKAGEDRGAESERFIAFAMLDGIRNTGDGTQQNPWLVTRTSDEYDCLMAEGARPTGQALLKNDGRVLDCMTLEDGRSLYFDITEIHAIMDRKFTDS